jgi:hypothetical protein
LAKEELQDVADIVINTFSQICFVIFGQSSTEIEIAETEKMSTKTMAAANMISVYISECGS